VDLIMRNPVIEKRVLELAHLATDAVRAKDIAAATACISQILALVRAVPPQTGGERDEDDLAAARVVQYLLKKYGMRTQ
jgi:hypothetical protein